MPFDINLWKDRVGAQTEEVRTWLKQREQYVKASAPHILYAGLCGMTLWPLVNAIQDGQVLSVMTALAGVAAGVGGNLVAEQIQRWKDSATPEAVVGWVAEEVPDNVDLRKSLDTMLERMETIPQVQTQLTEADRIWFDQELRKEMAALGNLSRFDAHLKGSGAIAQGRGRAIGERGVLIEGDVDGDITTGDKTTVFDQRGQHVGQQFNVAGDYHRSSSADRDDDTDT